MICGNLGSFSDRPSADRQPFDVLDVSSRRVPIAVSGLTKLRIALTSAPRLVVAILVGVSIGRILENPCRADDASDPIGSASPLEADAGVTDPPDFESIAEQTWTRIGRSVDRGIDFMIRQQNDDGSFGEAALERPAVTSLVAMAMISRGHIPRSDASASSPGRSLVRAVDFVLSGQGRDGLLGANRSLRSRHPYHKFTIYNHAICGVFLGEVYGMADASHQPRIAAAIKSALRWTRAFQQRPLPDRYQVRDRGGFRYLNMDWNNDTQSDLSVTSWLVMFMRSAENGGFDVPPQWAGEALRYVERCYDPRRQTFAYNAHQPHRVSRAMMGAGILCLSLTGRQNVAMETSARRWFLAHPMTRYNTHDNEQDHYHYAAYYTSQAAMQIGGEFWADYYRQLASVLMQNQNPDGSWQPEARHPSLGRIYSTSMAVLALTPPYQLLPIYQR